MNQLNLPLHPSLVHPLTGKPIRAIWQRPDGRLMWPIMGGAPEDDAAAAEAAAKAAADAAAKTAADEAAAAAEAKKKADDLGFPKDTPVAEMTDKQQAAYYKHQSRKHEERNREWSTAAGGKTAAEIKAELDAAEDLRKKNMSDQEKAVAEAGEKGKAEGSRTAALAAARMAFEFALDHDVEKNDQSDLIDTLDMSKVVKDNGEIDTAKVRSIVSKLSPAKGTNQNRELDFGAGRRRGGDGHRSAGKAEAERRFGTKTTTTQGA